MVSNVHVYGLEDSIKASKYPMSTDVSKCTGKVTKTVKALGVFQLVQDMTIS